MKNSSQDFDVTDILFSLFVDIFKAFIEDHPESRNHFKFDVRRFGKLVARYMYDYQTARQWNNVLRITASMLEYTKSGMDKLLKSKK